MTNEHLKNFQTDVIQSVRKELTSHSREPDRYHGSRQARDSSLRPSHESSTKKADEGSSKQSESLGRRIVKIDHEAASRVKTSYTKNEWTPGGQPICRKCDQPGHVFRNCPITGTKRKEEESASAEPEMKKTRGKGFGSSSSSGKDKRRP